MLSGFGAMNYGMPLYDTEKLATIITLRALEPLFYINVFTAEGDTLLTVDIIFGLHGRHKSVVFDTACSVITVGLTQGCESV